MEHDLKAEAQELRNYTNHKESISSYSPVNLNKRTVSLIDYEAFQRRFGNKTEEVRKCTKNIGGFLV